MSKFFLDQADVADDDEEEEEDYDRTQMMEEEILDKDKLAAIAAVERRHEEQRRFMEMSAEEKAKELEERFRRQEQARRRFGNIQVTGGNDKSAVAQQARNPSNADPPIFKVKCKPGSEMMLVRSILLKALESKSKGGFLLVKSAFFTGVKGCIYIEAVSEPFAKEAINGLRGHYPSSFVKIPLTDMTAVLTVAMKKKPIREGQWVRMRRGLYKGDLARVVALFDGGEKAFVQVVPRLDYSAPATNDRKSQAAKIRPTQRLFDPEEAKAVVGNGFVFRRHHPLDNNSPAYDVWQNDYFRDGLLYKEVTVATYLSDESVNPKLEELQLFLPKKSKRRDDDDDADDYDDNEQPDVEAKSFIEELAQQIKSIGEDDDKDTVSPFVPGDLVQITGGDMANFLARVKSVNDSLRVATVVPYRHSLTEEMQVELSLLVRYIETGNHVKVVSGKYTGQTGQVVSVDLVDGVHLATIITDTVNTQIRCNVAYVQVSILKFAADCNFPFSYSLLFFLCFYN